MTQLTEKKPKRLFIIDSLRGLMLVLLTLNHLSENPWRLLTFEPFGFFGAAEGFVFLSGLLAGIIYGRLPISEGLLVDKVSSRASLIGGAWLIIIFGRPILAHTLGGLSLGTFSVDSFQLPNPLGGNEVLGLYFGLFVLMNPAMVLLKRNRTLLLLLLSTALYFFAWMPQVYNSLAVHLPPSASSIGQAVLFLRGNVPTPFGEFYSNYESVLFALISWQLLFMIALSLGYHFLRGASFSWLRSNFAFFAALLLCSVFFVLNLISDSSNPIPSFFLEKGILGLARLVSFLAFSLLLFAIAIRIEKMPRFRALELLGRNSLPVYVYQTLLVFGVLNFYLPDPNSYILWSFLNLGVVASLLLVGFLFDKHSPAREYYPEFEIRKTIGQKFGLPEQLDWKRRFAVLIVVTYVVLSAVNLVRLREDFPFTAASMFARHIDDDTPMYSVRAYARTGDEATRLRFSTYSVNRRILFYSIYCSDEEDSPYYNPACHDESYRDRMERWFLQLHRRYIEEHGEAPEQFVLKLEPARGTDRTITLGIYDCDTSQLELLEEEAS